MTQREQLRQMKGDILASIDQYEKFERGERVDEVVAVPHASLTASDPNPDLAMSLVGHAALAFFAFGTGWIACSLARRFKL